MPRDNILPFLAYWVKVLRPPGQCEALISHFGKKSVPRLLSDYLPPLHSAVPAFIHTLCFSHLNNCNHFHTSCHGPSHCNPAVRMISPEQNSGHVTPCLNPFTVHPLLIGESWCCCWGYCGDCCRSPLAQLSPQPCSVVVMWVSLCYSS